MRYFMIFCAVVAMGFIGSANVKAQDVSLRSTDSSPSLERALYSVENNVAAAATCGGVVKGDNSLDCGVGATLRAWDNIRLTVTGTGNSRELYNDHGRSDFRLRGTVVIGF